MALPIHYNIRNIFVRWRATMATILGVALVVGVYICLQALAAGLERNSMSTGDPRNLMVVRKGANAESGSQITREQFKMIQYKKGIAQDENGMPIISADVILLASLPRRDSSAEANVQFRGISARGIELRPQVKLVAGRWFIPGRREVVVARRLSGRFANFEVGNRFRLGPVELTVVGWMDGNKSAFDSEVWMDTDEVRGLLGRDIYSSVLLRPESEKSRDALIRTLENDPRMVVKASPEIDYYGAQTRTARPIKFLGTFLATAMSIGAVFAAMNTMYASVGARTREIGTLRVLGYRRRTILVSFLLEGALLSLIGGLIGVGLSMLMHGYATSTVSLESFSEIVFEFRITPWLVAKGLIFSVLVGLVGSLLPSVRAARLPVIAALKAI